MIPFFQIARYLNKITHYLSKTEQNEQTVIQFCILKLMEKKYVTLHSNPTSLNKQNHCLQYQPSPLKHRIKKKKSKSPKWKEYFPLSKFGVHLEALKCILIRHYQRHGKFYSFSCARKCAFFGIEPCVIGITNRTKCNGLTPAQWHISRLVIMQTANLRHICLRRKKKIIALTVEITNQ